MIIDQHLNYYYANGNYLEVLKSKEDVLKNWDFLKEGFDQMNNPAKANMNESESAFSKTLIKAVYSWPDAFVGVLRSKNGKVLGYGVGYDSTSAFQDSRSLWIYATYSNRKYKNTVKDMLSWAELFAKQYGFSEIGTATGRINGAAFYWYEKRLGFSRRFVTFRKGV